MLTDAQCKNAVCPPEAKRERLADSGGLYLEISPAGSKRWFWKYRLAGTEKRLALGSYPAVSLKEARLQRDEAKRLKADGHDPVQTRKIENLKASNESADTYKAVALKLLLPETTRKQETSPPGPSIARGALGAAAALATRQRPKAAETVAAELRRQIITGQLQPGDKLHSENVLQAEFAISRPTMREAMRILESESLIAIRRGKYGGAYVTDVDLDAAARQVGVFLQMQGTTLQDVWHARTIIEPPAVGMLAAQRNPLALAELDANIAAAREAAQKDLMLYAKLSVEFSMIITRHCGSKTLHLFASLTHDIIRRDHEHVTRRTLAKANVERARLENLRSRERALELMRSGTPAQAETHWRAHLEHLRDMVVAAYAAPMVINLLNQPAPVQRAPMVKRHALPAG